MVYENYRAALRRLRAPFDRYGHQRRVAKAVKLSRRARQRGSAEFEDGEDRQYTLICQNGSYILTRR